jgi:hypothetical protein
MAQGYWFMFQRSISDGDALAAGAKYPTKVLAQLIAQDVLRSFGNVKCVITWLSARGVYMSE